MPIFRGLSRGRHRWYLAGALAAAVTVAAVLAVGWPGRSAQAATKVVTSISALQTALNSAAPGDVIQLADGSYSTSSTITINRAGSADAPITVQAQHVGGVTISGSGGFSIGSGRSYVVL